MEAWKEISHNWLKWFEARGIDQSQLVAAGLVLVLLSFLFAFSAWRRAKNVTGGITLRHLDDKVEKSTLQVADARSRVEKDLHRFGDDLAFLKERIAKIERQLSIDPEVDTKKKTAESVIPRTEEAQTPDGDELPTAEQDLAAAVEISAAESAADRVSPLQDTERPKASIFSGLKKTRDVFFSRLSGILTRGSKVSSQTYEQLEELLITSDLGVKTTQLLLDAVKQKVEAGEIEDADGCKEILKSELLKILERPGNPEIVPAKLDGKPLVILVVGVNGVGKTTTIGKLANRFAATGSRILLGAADTFRAAAAEQIEVWAERAEVEVLRGAENAKPSTVAYEAIHKAQDGGFDVVIIDTAGRLHTRVNLMNELGGVVSLIGREQPGAPHEVLLVVDATTGQNALEQAKEFHQRAKLTGLVVTKLDGTPKGGIVVAICNELGLPVRYVGVGESAADLKAFSAREFVSALFAEGEQTAFTASQEKSQSRAVRRRPSGDSALLN